jgi:hypothetical protein
MVNLSHSIKKTFRTDIADWLKRRDLFGVSIGLVYKDSQVHRTVLSGVISMLLRIYMVHFAASTYVKIWRGHTENVYSQIMTFDLDDPSERIIPSELGFNLGFGFMKGLPAAYGNIRVTVVSMDNEGNKIET